MIETIQPIVLVGGKSRRFGRDKLREPVGDGWLVDVPRRALREVFGPVVAAVGECHPEVAARFDRVIADRYPGVGPIGGVLSALEETEGAVFVLPGDLARVTAEVVREILRAAEGAPDADAVTACGTRGEPCVGVYRASAAAALRARIQRGEFSLKDSLAAGRRVEVPVEPGLLVNANTPGELGMSG